MSYRVPSVIVSIPIGLLNSYGFLKHSDLKLSGLIPIVFGHIVIGYFIGDAGLSQKSDGSFYIGLNSSDASEMSNGFTLSGNMGISTGFRIFKYWTLGFDFDYIHRKIIKDEVAYTRSKYVDDEEYSGGKYTGYDEIYEGTSTITHGIIYMPVTVAYTYDLNPINSLKFSLGYGSSFVSATNIDYDDKIVRKKASDTSLDGYPAHLSEYGVRTTVKSSIDFNINRHIIKASIFSDFFDEDPSFDKITTYSLQYGWKFH